MEFTLLGSVAVGVAWIALNLWLRARGEREVQRERARHVLHRPSPGRRKRKPRAVVRAAPGGGPTPSARERR
jgi:hypothetical protein